MQNIQKEIDKIITDKNEEISHLKNHIQNLIAQIKKLKGEKNSQTKTLKQLTSKNSLIDKETLIDPIEIKKSSVVKIQVAEKETKTSSFEVETVEIWVPWKVVPLCL
jgi:prefoldin subunit 5